MLRASSAHADGDFVDTTKLEGKRLKISKRQLQRIIKEEKDKILNESTPMRNAQYQQGSYANVSLVDAVASSIESLMNQVLDDEDVVENFDEFEGDRIAANVVTYTVLRALNSVGLVAQGQALEKFLDRG